MRPTRSETLAKTPFRWTINGRFLTQRVTGVQRYAREIVRTIDQLIDDGDERADLLSFRVVCPSKAILDLELKHIPILRGGWSAGQVWEQTYLGPCAGGGLLSLCNTGPIVHPRHIVCIHDANSFDIPESYSARFRMAYRFLTPLLGRTAQIVSTVSEYSAGRLIANGLTIRDKIVIAPNGSDHALRWKVPDNRNGSIYQDTRIVLLGSLAAHKNIGLILSIAQELNEKGFRIAVVGGFDQSVFREKTNVAAVPNIDWLGPLDDPALAELLQDSLCLAFPSLAEGFGLPLVEAMALGCPVVCSNRTSLPEVGGDAAIFVDPNDRAGWVRAFVELRERSEWRLSIVRKGYERAKKFQWCRTAGLYLDYMRVLSFGANARARHQEFAKGEDDLSLRQ